MIELDWQRDFPLSKLCTFGIGGPTRYYLPVDSYEAMAEALTVCHSLSIPFFILGKGSNCLFSDDGFAGVLIHNKIDFLQEIAPGRYCVGAGYNFSLLGVKSARRGWGGLEFASGIPASVGGAIFMNAGANGGETADALLSVDFIDMTGELKTIDRNDLSFGYRHSPFQNLAGAIVGATFQLTASDSARQTQRQIIEYRKKTQPQGVKSAGCVFRNPSHSSAGEIISRHGLKGLAMGGAVVSDIHANFIINSGSATSTEVVALIARIRGEVREKEKVDLESEMRILDPYGQLY